MSDMIPEAAVEAAARAESERDRPGMWEHESEQFKDALRREARLHLEAAAPHMLAGAWDEGYTIGNAHNGRRDANPYRPTP